MSKQIGLLRTRLSKDRQIPPTAEWHSGGSDAAGSLAERSQTGEGCGRRKLPYRPGQWRAAKSSTAESDVLGSRASRSRSDLRSLDKRQLQTSVLMRNTATHHWPAAPASEG